MVSTRRVKTYAIDLQVVKYSPGQEFEPHRDYAEVSIYLHPIIMWLSKWTSLVNPPFTELVVTGTHPTRYLATYFGRQTKNTNESKLSNCGKDICYYYKNERSKITDNNVKRLQYWPLIITENHTFVFTLFQNPSIFGGSGNRVATALFYVSSKDDDEFIYSFMCCRYYTFWFNIQRNTCLLLSHN